MLKKYISILTLIISSAIFAQGDNSFLEDQQKDFFEHANLALKNGETVRAISLFSMTKANGFKKEWNEFSSKKLDSLKPIARAAYTQQIAGTWRMFETRANWAMRDITDSLVGKMITIEPTQILFFELYDKSRKWNLVKTEKLNFSEKDNSSFNPFLIVYSNKEVWSYYIDENFGNLVAYFIGEENENGMSEIICGTTKLEYYKLQ